MSRLRELASKAMEAENPRSDVPRVSLLVAEAAMPIIANAPSLAVLLADAKDALAKHTCRRKSGYQVRVVEVARDTYRQVSDPGPLPVEACPTCALLARIEELEGRA